MITAPLNCRSPPFQSLSPHRSQRSIVPLSKAQKVDAVPGITVGGLAQLLHTAPAWAEDLVTEVQKIDVPTVPTAEEVRLLPGNVHPKGV
jgi:hypothetical protein